MGLCLYGIHGLLQDIVCIAYAITTHNICLTGLDCSWHKGCSYIYPACTCACTFACTCTCVCVCVSLSFSVSFSLCVGR